MKKIIFVLIGFFLCSISLFASGEKDILLTSDDKNTCIEASCYEDQIKKLIEINEKLQEENEDLSQKYESFNKPLESYIKILSESKILSDFKSNAYDVALNQIKYWFWIIFGIFSSLLAIGGYFGFRQFPDIRKRIIADIKSDIAIEIDEKLKNNGDELGKKIEKDIELGILRINEELSYKKIKEIENTIMNSINDIVLDKTDELIKDGAIDGKVSSKISEELDKIFPKS